MQSKLLQVSFTINEFRITWYHSFRCQQYFSVLYIWSLVLRFSKLCFRNHHCYDTSNNLVGNVYLLHSLRKTKNIHNNPSGFIKFSPYFPSTDPGKVYPFGDLSTTCNFPSRGLLWNVMYLMSSAKYNETFQKRKSANTYQYPDTV